MLNLRKTLLAGAVLTALCATAFAAAPADDASQPTMRERVNAILHEHDADDNAPALHRNDHRRPPLTPEQREKFAQRRAEWEKMTPEQRREAHEKWRQEWQQRHEQYAKEAMAKLTDEQRAEVEAFIKEDIAQRQERREKLHNMTPEQRDAIRANYPRHHREWRDHRGGFDHWRGFGPHHGGPRPDCRPCE